jgi:hypothetical protein
MNDPLLPLMGRPVEVEVTGPFYIAGLMADLGPDVTVVQSGEQFYYIPLLHIHAVQPGNSGEDSFMDGKTELPHEAVADPISFRKMLMHAKGQFIEMNVTGRDSIHGCVTAIMNDYVEFYSPVFGTVYVLIEHIKFIVPHTGSSAPYGLKTVPYPVHPSRLDLSRTFRQQLQKSVGDVVVMDLCHNPDKIGMLRSADDQWAELIRSDGTAIKLNIRHVKSFARPPGPQGA